MQCARCSTNTAMRCRRDPVSWLGRKVTLYSFVIVNLWGAIGGGMFICLAGLQAIPKQYYEVAGQFDMALIPHSPTLQNYPKLFQIMPFHLLLWTSMKLAAISVAGQLLACSMAAFLFAVVRLPFGNALFVLPLVTLMVPVQVTTIAQFIIFKWLGLYGTQARLYLPSFLGGAFGTHMPRHRDKRFSLIT